MFVDDGLIIIVTVFLLYYFLVLIIEKEMMVEPKEIIEKFLSVILLYAGISLIYFAFTGEPMLNDSPETYSVYIFIIGFITILWTVPNLLKRFSFFRRYIKSNIVYNEDSLNNDIQFHERFIDKFKRKKKIIVNNKKKKRNNKKKRK